MAGVLPAQRGESKLLANSISFENKGNSADSVQKFEHSFKFLNVGLEVGRAGRRRGNAEAQPCGKLRSGRVFDLGKIADMVSTNLLTSVVKIWTSDGAEYVFDVLVFRGSQ
ncbi:MAG TPA: hypothetical protein VN754_06625 [Candidatus Binataceae bacterium]|nr:hypothetical protein [Candidatus Binataceae bacterium]